MSRKAQYNARNHFYVEEYLDDSGVSTYVAFHADVFNGDGVPFAHAPRAEGETPLRAIAARCAVLDNINDVA